MTNYRKKKRNEHKNGNEIHIDLDLEGGDKEENFVIEEECKHEEIKQNTEKPRKKRKRRQKKS